MCSVICKDVDITFCKQNGSSEQSSWVEVVEENLPAAMFTFAYSMLPMFVYQSWFSALIGSILIGLSGVFPILVIRIQGKYFVLNGKSALKVLLSFAAGCLLGDVFLHLLPEVWVQRTEVDGHPSMIKNLWILAGLLMFIVFEKTFAFMQNNENHSLTVKENASSPQERTTSIHVSGYLNLLANFLDNFTHGLAIGGSFLGSFPRGMLTTFAILLHEIPHEIGDFAILLRAGFTQWEAAKAQMLTATGGIIGALAAVAVGGSTGTIESWLLPFTAGGFLHIALVALLPELLQEENPRESFKQLASLLFGIGVTAALQTIVEE